MKTCTIDSIELSYVDRGTGAALLFVHGFPLDHSMWNAQIEEFSPQCRVIAPDLRGFGQSGVGDDVATMEQFADDLAALLDYLSINEPIVLCGLSMGGYIALAFWRWHTTRLRGLILCDTRAGNDSPQAVAGRLAMAEKVLCEGANTVSDMMIPRLFAPITLQKQPQLVESIRQTIGRTDRRGIAAAARGMAERTDFTAELPRIKCPTLVIVGENDAITPPADMQKLKEAIPKAEFATIPHAGHMAPLEQPAHVNAVIKRFLWQNRMCSG